MSESNGLTHNQCRQRLLNDYDRLIADFEESIAKAGDTFMCWMPPIDGKLVLAALRESKSSALKIPEWNGPGTHPHEYHPDAQAMGDCSVCGHTAQSHFPSAAEGEHIPAKLA